MFDDSLTKHMNYKKHTLFTKKILDFFFINFTNQENLFPHIEFEFYYFECREKLEKSIVIFIKEDITSNS